jgi:Flp pilus assembly pilin Flp
MKDKPMAKRLFRNQSGATLMEFGLIAPPMMLMLIGTMELGHGYYVRTVLNGSLRDAARDSSLEAASAATAQTTIDLKLKNTIKKIAPTANVEIKRRYYKTFSNAAAADPEPIIANSDSNGDTKCDIGERFLDINNNGTWDEDGGDSGQGGARDIVIIKAVVSYKRMFPLDKMMGISDGVTIISDSILANQPYGQQQQYGTPTSTLC